MRVRATLAAICLFPWGGAATAHPHIFIDTDFALVFDASGDLAAIRVDWTYDDLYSLLMIEENGLDADMDGTPEQDRMDAFAGRDVDWAAGFPGDFTVAQGNQHLELMPPTDHRVRYEDGRITTSHVRALASPVRVPAEGLVVRSYDPSYFVAYDVPEEPAISGREDCRLTRNRADRKAAQDEYGQRLAALDVSDDPFEEIEIPDIGILFADSFLVTCDALP